MEDINIHIGAPEHLLSERFNNFLKPLDFVKMNCIQEKACTLSQDMSFTSSFACAISTG